MNISIKKRPNQPDFVLGNFGFKVSDLKEYITPKGWVNGEVLKGKDNDSYYIKISSFGINKEEKDEEIPF